MNATTGWAALNEGLKRKRCAAPLAVVLQADGECRQRHHSAVGIHNKLNQCPAGCKRPCTGAPSNLFPSMIVPKMMFSSISH